MNVNTHSYSGARTPVQQRSRATEQRIICAFRELLNEKPLRDVTVGDIARRAGVAVGSVYTRFRDKDALLQVLFRVYQEERAASMETTFAEARWECLSLEETVAEIVRITVAHFSTDTGLIRAFTQYYRENPADQSEEFRSGQTPLYERIKDILMLHVPVMGHSNPEQACRFAFFLITSACQNYLVYDQDTHPLTLKAARVDLQRELTLSCVRYLRGGSL